MSKGKKKEDVEVSFNSEGFYEVQVHYDHMAKLAAGCGFTNEDVEQAINIDNAQHRQIPTEQTTESNQENEDSADFEMGRFELDSEDELTSEEEA